MHSFSFSPATNTADWHQPFYVLINNAYPAWVLPDDEVLLGVSPDVLTWEDYGAHRNNYTASRANNAAPYVRASSNDSSGYITLISPGLIDVLLPASVMRAFPPGEVNVGLRYARASDGRTSSLLTGRLPVVHGVV
jgi:hypothetical protein